MESRQNLITLTAASRGYKRSPPRTVCTGRARNSTDVTTPKVPAAAAERPEEILVLRVACGKHPPVGGDDFAREQVVDRHTVLPKQPAHATAERESADAGLRDDATGNGEPEDVGFAIQVAERCAALHPRRGTRRVYVNGPHSAQIDDEAVVAQRAAAYVVASAADGGNQIVCPPEIDGCDHIRDTGTARDQLRPRKVGLD